MKTIFDELKQEVKNWWVSLILGILYVAVALGLMFFPFNGYACLLYTSPSPRDVEESRMPSSA